MARQRTIIGLGETVLAEHPDRLEATGLAAEIARQAVRFGHRGIIVSRVGQDPPAEELTRLLVEAGVDTSHLQSDPDLPTGRLIARAFGEPVRRYLEAPAAFDNLQSDFDLEDVAQQADAVVFGLLARRRGQTRAEEDRFLSACAAALKVFDLTNHEGRPFERPQVLAGLSFADVIIVDRTAANVVLPGGRDAPPEQRAGGLAREFALSLVVLLEDDGDERRMHACAGEEHHAASLAPGGTARAAMTVGLLHALLAGRSTADAVELAASSATHALEHPDERPPIDPAAPA